MSDVWKQNFITQAKQLSAGPEVSERAIEFGFNLLDPISPTDESQKLIDWIESWKKGERNITTTIEVAEIAHEYGYRELMSVAMLALVHLYQSERSQSDGCR